MRRRVAVTGLGTVSGAGGSRTVFKEALCNGKRAFVPIESPLISDLKATHFSGVDDGDLTRVLAEMKAVGEFDRVVMLALTALREALESAGLKNGLGETAGLVLGTCSGGMLSIESHYRSLANHEDKLSPERLFSKRYFGPAKVLAWAAGIAGPVTTIVTACAAGAGAIAQGADLIRSGMVDVVLSGGADTFAQSTLVGFDALKATCEGVCTPFSQNIGLNLGEGAAFLVLEEMSRALERGAALMAEVTGSGLSNDAFHATSPDPAGKGQIAAMNRAFRDAGIDADRIEYINAHGTGTRANDPVECRSVRKVLGERADAVPMSSTKSMIGHCLGAAGALEAAATILSLGNGFLPPTAGFTTSRDGCRLGDFVSDPGRSFSGSIALTNSFGFAGNNTCLVLDTSPNPASSTEDDISEEDQRVVITGYGAVHALGVGFSPLVDEDSNGIHPAKRLQNGTVNAGLVPEIQPRQIDRRLDIRGMDRCSQYATYAARMALASSTLSLRPSKTADIGVVMGLSSGPTEGESIHLRTCFESSDHLGRLDAFPYVVQNEVVGHVARAMMLRGHNTVLSGGWGAGLSAVISGTIAIQQGHSDAIAAVASDELTERTLADGIAVGVWGPDTSVTPGEGAAALVIERASHADGRGGEPIAEIMGFSIRTDTSDPRYADGSSVGRAIDEAIARAGIDPGEVSGVAISIDTRDEGRWEREAVEAYFSRALPICLHRRLGFAEASSSLIGLGVLLARAKAGECLAATALSQEGVASAIIVKVLNPFRYQSS